MPNGSGPKHEPKLISNPKCVRVADRNEAAKLNETVSALQRSLFEKDQETTRLTAALKKIRMDIWAKQREQSAAEQDTRKVLRQREKELPAMSRSEERSLDAEEQDLAEKLTEARAASARWLSVARRQDAILEHEKAAEREEDPRLAIAKSPAGEVFLSTARRPDFDRGYESSDGPPWPRGGRDGRHSVDLSDDDASMDDEFHPSGGRRGSGPFPPVRPAQQWRHPLGGSRDGEDDDDEDAPAARPAAGAGSDTSSDDATPQARWLPRGQVPALPELRGLRGGLGDDDEGDDGHTSHRSV